MNKKQADIEAEKIFKEHNKKIDEITKKAKEDGNWKMGLDSNTHLFDGLNMETKEKLKKLASMINE